MTEYIPMIERLAGAYCAKCPYAIEFDDCRSIGILAMARLLERMSPDDPNFEGAAVLRIRGAFIDHVRKSTQYRRMGENVPVTTLNNELYSKEIAGLECGSDTRGSAVIDDLKTVVRKSLGILSERQRKAVEMSYFLDYQQKDIAKALGISRTMISFILTAARKRLSFHPELKEQYL